MDPISVLRSRGEVAKPFDNGTNYEHLQYYGGTKEINRYRAVVNVTKVVEMFSFLNVLKTVWEENEENEGKNHSKSLLKK